MNKNESKYFNTARRMDDALIALLEHKDFEYITIKEICKKANVNRSTFYLHYDNANDLLEEVIELLNASFISHLDTQETIQTIAAKNNLNDLYLIKDEFLIPYLNFIKDNKNIYKAVKNHPELFNIGSTYEKLFNSLFVPIMNKFGLKAKWHKYLMDFYVNGINSLILDWVLDDCEISVEEISKFIRDLVVNYDKKTS